MKPWTSVAVALVSIGLAVALGCGGYTNRVHVDDTGGVSDTGVDSQDLRTVAQKMARSLIEVPEIAHRAEPVRIAFLEVRNKTSDILDTEMFLRKIRRLMLKHGEGKMRFLDRARVKAIIKEREAKRAGLIVGDATKGLAGADFFLTGVISSIDKAQGDRHATYTMFSFRLVDAETSEIIWEDEYEMKKAGSRATWDY